MENIKRKFEAQKYWLQLKTQQFRNSTVLLITFLASFTVAMFCWYFALYIFIYAYTNRFSESFLGEDNYSLFVPISFLMGALVFSALSIRNFLKLFK